MSSITGLISGGGGGGTPVNGIERLFVGGQTQYTDEAGGVWLKTGNIIGIDSTTYPDAYANNQNISDSSYDNISVTVLGDNWDLKFSNDGLNFFYAAGTTRSSIEQYRLSTAGDLTSAARLGSYYTSAVFSNPRGVAFNNDGTKMFIFNAGGASVHQYSLSTPFTIVSGVTNDNVSASVTGGGSISFSDDGLKLYTVDNVTVREYTLSSAFDLSSVTLTTTQSFSGTISGANSLVFLNGGTKMYILSGSATGRPVYQFTLSTAFDLSTATYDTSFNVGAVDSQTNGIAFMGAKMYINGAQYDKVYQFSAGLSYMGLGTDTGTYDYVKLK